VTLGWIVARRALLTSSMLRVGVNIANVDGAKDEGVSDGKCMMGDAHLS